MHKKLATIGSAGAVALLFSACGPSVTSAEEEIKDGVHIVATFSIVADMVQNIAGPQAHVHSIVPLGDDPHEYTPLAADIEETTHADVVFFNGLNMEVTDGWFESLIDPAGKEFVSYQFFDASLR